MNWVENQGRIKISEIFQFFFSEILMCFKLQNNQVSLHTALRYIDKDNFECPELGVVQKCSIILGDHQSPGGKFF